MVVDSRMTRKPRRYQDSNQFEKGSLTQHLSLVPIKLGCTADTDCTPHAFLPDNVLHNDQL